MGVDYLQYDKLAILKTMLGKCKEHIEYFVVERHLFSS